MPVEFSRTTARKRITLPNGGTVDVPVITEISFIDPNDRYQETIYTIDNSGASDRIVHVDVIGGNFEVERVDIWKILDPVDRGQETQITFDNVTGADLDPPHFSTHERTHVVRYKNNPDDGNYIDSELIDEFWALDPTDRGQETRWVLNNPQTDEEAQADPDDPDISDPSHGIDSPWRTDPFQNIIAISEVDRYILAYVDIGFWYGPLTTFGGNDVCIGPQLGSIFTRGIASGDAHMKVKLQSLAPGWTRDGFPTEGESAPWSWTDYLGDPLLVDFPSYLQINKDEGTAYALDLPTGDAALYGDFGSNLQFTIDAWNTRFPTTDNTLYQSCIGGIGGLGGPFGYSNSSSNWEGYQHSQLSFDLTGATLTNNNNTGGPLIYRAIGTKNSQVPTDMPFINQLYPPPYNVKITELGDRFTKPAYIMQDLPFFSGGPIESMYVINPTFTHFGSSDPDPAKGYPLRIIVLMQLDEGTA